MSETPLRITRICMQLLSPRIEKLIARSEFPRE